MPRDRIALPPGIPQRHAVVASPAWLEGKDAPRSPTDPPVRDCIRVRLPDGALYRWQFGKDGEA